MANYASPQSNDMFKRGDIFYADIVSSEHCSHRPVIIVSNNRGNAYSPNVTVVPLMTQPKRPMPTHVEVACRTQSTALCENVQTISKDRLGTYIRSCTSQEMRQIDTALACAIGLTVQTAQMSPDQDLSVQLAKLEAQCDLYKKLYSLLLGRLTRMCKKLFEN